MGSMTQRMGRRLHYMGSATTRLGSGAATAALAGLQQIEAALQGCGLGLSLGGGDCLDGGRNPGGEG